MKRGCTLVVKRAQSRKVAAPPFQSYEISNDLLNAGGIKYLRYGIVRDQGLVMVLDMQNNEKMDCQRREKEFEEFDTSTSLSVTV